MSKVTSIIIYFIVGAIILDVLTHSGGFSQATGTLFNGFNGSLKTISGQ